MNILRKFGCVFLSLIILSLSVLCSTESFIRVNAADIGYVDATDVNVRADATVNSKSYGKLSNVYVTINGQKNGDDGYIWYNITYNNITGYMRSDYIKKIVVQPDKSFEEQLAAFPESYRSQLKLLHAQYPNWKFYADNINLTLDEAVGLELVNKVYERPSLSWRSMDKGSYNWASGKWASQENGRWYYVSREVIKYYMDARNFLNENDIYAFMLQYNNMYLQNEESVKKVVAGKFLESGYNDPNDNAYGGSYIKVIMKAAKEVNVDPCVLAAAIIQEQGSKGTTNLISGKYPGYEGYYNFFNIKANGENPTLNGLKYAESMGWDSRSEAIIEGAKFWREMYIGRGQDTYFYMNYDIKDSANNLHQYATAVNDSIAKGNIVSKGYKDLKIAELVFKIPVYKDMPSSVAKLPEKNDSLNNYYFNSISVEGLTDTFSRFTYSYDLKVSADTVVKVTMPTGASYAGAPHFRLKAGQNRVTLTVKAQTGYTNDYVIDVLADKACVLYVDSGAGITPIDPDTEPTPDPTPEPQIMRGDTNGDGKVDILDLANVKRHILKVSTLSGNSFSAGDTNNDGVIDIIDLANIKRHILHIIVLT